jgi:hypothetical protein
LLWLGLLSRDTGTPASTWLGISDEADALSLSLAVTLRLLRYDNERERENRKFWVSIIHGDQKAREMFDDVLDSSVLNDPYSDANTQVW